MVRIPCPFDPKKGNFEQSGSQFEMDEEYCSQGMSRDFQPLSDDKAPHSRASVPEFPRLSLPKGGGAVQGIGEKFAANPVAGSGHLAVPVYTSPGRAGFGPELTLTYDSGSGNGPFGFGWSLSLPAISRKTDKGLPQYQEESDVFLLSGAEDLVPSLIETGGQWQREVLPSRTSFGKEYEIHRYRPRVEGLFVRIERWRNTSDPADTFWRSISKDNATTWYGKTAESRVSDPNEPQRIFSWLISESSDGKGNVLAYRYKAEDSAGIDLAQAHERNRSEVTRSAGRYLKSVFYGNRTPYFPDLNAPSPPDLPTDWCFELVLDYGEHDLSIPVPQETGSAWDCRKDPFSTYRSTFEVRTYRLCRRALMFHHFPHVDQVGMNCLVRSTEFLHAASPPDDSAAPFYSFLRSVQQTGYVRNATGGYLASSFPPIEFDYSQATISEDIQDVDDESLANLPYGMDGSHYRWVDLEGEGVSGVLTEQAGAWYYKPNLSPAKTADAGASPSTAAFGPMQVVVSKPSLASLSQGKQQLMSLSGNGRLDLVEFGRPVPGFFERTEEGNWRPFQTFRSLPVLDWQDPNLRFIDLTGDGFPDLLISEDHVFQWHSSLSSDGFGEANRVPQSLDDEQGPQLIFSDGTETIFLADMSGDGLTDLVRVRSGEVCYWPNLGYGRFGAKVSMDNAPVFDGLAQFDARRLRLADIDGSATTDLLYFASDGVQLYFNQSGNAWGAARTLRNFPLVNDVSTASVFDLLGNGTACLVWSSPLPTRVSRPMRFIDLMGGQKPHLLVRMKNNLGAETRVVYAPSTKFHVQDKLAGTPWLTRIPFPVHVVERVETYDYISRNRFVTRYSYHHGYFDGVEREFRGFGRVDQLDTEELATLSSSFSFPAASNENAASAVPPVLTKTWYHTGIFFDARRVSKHFEAEYYAEGDRGEALAGLTEVQLESMLLDDTVFPASILRSDGTATPYDLSGEEVREACRALRGSILRQEVYGLDGTDQEDRPYLVSERNYTIEILQPRGVNQFGVFLTHPRETVDFHYERKLFKIAGNRLADENSPPSNPKAADPRITHALTLAADVFGNVLQSVSIGYGRRYLDPGLPTQDQARQGTPLVTYTENSYTNPVSLADSYRTPFPAQSSTYELLQMQPATTQAGITNLFGFAELRAKVQAVSDGAHEVPFEQPEPNNLTGGEPYRRLMRRMRTYYRPDDMGAAEGNENAIGVLGKLESQALPGVSYKLAFTPGLITQAYVRADAALLPTPTDVLGSTTADGGGYVDLDHDGNWWLPSGRVFYSTTAVTPAIEEAEAKQNFFQVRRFVDPFGSEATVGYDAPHRLFVNVAQDTLGNTTAAIYDYRVLAPTLCTDANGNRAGTRFDRLGKVVGTVVMGKTTENVGDSFATFSADPDPAQIDSFYGASTPHTTAPDLLGTATTRIVYDLFRFLNSQKSAPDDPTRWQPVFAATIARETHVSDLAPGQQSRLQVSFSYSDGFDREIQKKIQAEPGPVVEGGPTVNPRWIGSGWTIFNNKGEAVRKYEPFFSQLPTAGHQFEFGVQVGVSPILCYDPTGRVVATIHPNRTYEKVVFDPWHQETWDVNDTVLAIDPKTDIDVGAFFSRLPSVDYSPTWYAERSNGGLGAREQLNAAKAVMHAGTPGASYCDVLGRDFFTIADNASSGKYLSRAVLNIDGSHRSVHDLIVLTGDQQGRMVERYEYDLAGNRIHQTSMEGGERWMLMDCTGKPIRSWDSRGHDFRTEYDALRRPTGSFVFGTDNINSDARTTASEVMYEKTIYGEGQPAALNLRTRVFEHSAAAGIATNKGTNPGTGQEEGFDFKGNLLRSSQGFFADYIKLPDLTANTATPDTFGSATKYDALSRAIVVNTPDGSITELSYNEANLLQSVSVQLSGSSGATPFVTSLAYNAKGQRERIAYGNNASTTYTYDPKTFRLTRLRTLRAGFPANQQSVQDLNYLYDPIGNITCIQDNADIQNVVFFRNKRVDPSNDFTYDAIYRLLAASGREQLSQNGSALIALPSSYNDVSRTGLLSPGDGHAMGTYTEEYHYDAAGNFMDFVHRGSDPANAGWSRTYTYNEASLLEPGKFGNRLTLTSVSGSEAMVEPYRYDPHGNMASMPQLQSMVWTFKDELHMTRRQAVNPRDADGVSHEGERTYYVYDSSGQRVRKVTESAGGIKQKERFYVGGIELYREFTGGTTITLARETLHVMDDKQRVAVVETRTQGSDGAPGQLLRYQFTNHLGSACLELDAAAQVISYEEYCPYGNTSYQAGHSTIEVTQKRYRYTGLERDEESGLNFHHARYYAMWLGRWTSCDPAGLRDGSNVYSFVSGNPLRLVDTTGTNGRQLWLAEHRKFNITPVATRTGRGITPLQHKALRGIGHAFGPGRATMDWGHPANRTHGTTRAGQSPPLRPQPNAENRSSFPDKQFKQQAAARGEFVRDAKGVDPTVPKGTKFSQPAPRDFERPMADYADAPGTPPTRVPRAPVAAARPSGNPNQLELPLERQAPSASAHGPAPVGGGSRALRTGGKVLGAAGVAGAAGEIVKDLHEGNYGHAAVTGGVAVGVGHVLSKVPALVPIAVMVSTISSYDEKVQEHANSVAEWVDPGNHTVIGGVVAATWASGESAYNGTFKAAGTAIGEGAAAAYIRLTSDEYTLKPWKSQLWADIFD